MKKLLLIFCFSLIAGSLFAQSGLKILEVGPTAAELSVSEATMANPNGATSIYTNPALLVMNPNSSINLGYTSWISSSNNLFGGLNLIKDRRALAFGFYTSGISGFEQRNVPGESNGEFSIQYVSISGAYAYDFKYFTAGMSAHYLNEDVYPYRASGYGINIGLASSLLEDKIRIGAAFRNLGEMENLNQSATELPSSFNLGFAADVVEFIHQKNPDLPILATIMVDFVFPTAPEKTGVTDFTPDENYLNLGLSLTVSEVVVVNAGYKTQNNARPVSFGVGFIAEKVTFNYALVPFNTGFGTVHSIGLQYQL